MILGAHHPVVYFRLLNDPVVHHPIIHVVMSCPSAHPATAAVMTENHSLNLLGLSRKLCGAPRSKAFHSHLYPRSNQMRVQFFGGSEFHNLGPGNERWLLDFCSSTFAYRGRCLWEKRGLTIVVQSSKKKNAK